jgi:hypothetical protein
LITPDSVPDHDFRLSSPTGRNGFFVRPVGFSPGSTKPAHAAVTAYKRPQCSKTLAPAAPPGFQILRFANRLF